MVVHGREIVHAQRPGQGLAAAAGARVDDCRGAAQLVQAADECPQPRLLAVDELDVVAEVGADDARPHDLRLAAERRRDLPLGGRRGGRGHPEDRRFSERVERAPDEEVVGPKVVAPHAHAVDLVDHHEPDVDAGDGLEEAPLPQPLRCHVEHPVAAFGHPAQPSCRLVRAERGVDQRRLLRHLRRQLVDLVLHQRDQRREDECRRRSQHRGELVGERLAGAGRHQRERVAAVHGGADDLFLAGAEVLESEQPCQCGLQLAHANECRERIGTHSSELRDHFPSGSLERGCGWARGCGPTHGRYSYCSASRTFSFEARFAGRIAASIPAMIATPTKTPRVP